MKKVLIVMMVLLMALSTAACSGSTGSSATPTATVAQTEAPSNTVAATSSAAQTTTAGASASASAQVFGQIENKVPAAATKAPKNLKVAVVMGNASMSGSSVPCAAIESICKHFGWTSQTWDGEGDPSKENNAIISAISWGANCIITCSVQAKNVQSALQAANGAKIPCGSLSCGNDTPNPVQPASGFNYSFDIGPYYHDLGYAVGKWMVANKTGSGKVACWDFAGEYSIQYTKEGLYQAFKDNNVTYSDQGCFTFDQIGDVLNRTVATYLTKNPDTEFIYFPFDPAAQPVSEFLDLNGYKNVKVIGVLGNSEMVALIKQGSVASATAAYDNTYMGYAAMDQMLRVINGDALIDPHGENIPYLVLDKSNAPAGDSGWVAPFDYASSFYKVWVQQ